MMGVERERSRSRIVLAAVKPSTPGRRASIKMTAKSCLRTQRSASSPDAARTTSCPEDCRSSCNAIRFFGSSSTIRMQARVDVGTTAFSCLTMALNPAITLLQYRDGSYRPDLYHRRLGAQSRHRTRQWHALATARGSEALQAPHD